MTNLGAWALLMALVWAGFQAEAQTQTVNVGEPTTIEGAGTAAPVADEFKNFDESLVTTTPRLTAPPSRVSFFRMEPVLGLNESTIEGSGHIGGTTIQPLMGYQGGVGVVLGRSHLKFESGMIYAQRGMQYVSAFDSGSKFTLQSTYLEIPALVHWGFRDQGNSNLFVKGGMVAAILQDATGSYSGNRAFFQSTPVYSSMSDQNLKDSMEALDVRAQVGVGMVYRLNKGASWVIQGDYQHSVNNIAKSRLTSDVLYNSSLGFTTGISLDL